MSDYRGMLAALVGARRFGVRFDLERMRALLDRLGAPDRRLGAVVHVGGTNGKGSTAALVEAALRQAGLKTGLYTSPHLARFTERIRIAGEEAAPADCVRAFEAVGRATGGEEWTFFEQVTAMALLCFAEAATQVVVLEVGLGGRLDATNVVDADVAIVTGVSLDHTEVLGERLDEIAFEKAGIFKAGRAAIIGAGGEAEAVPWLEADARQRGAAPVWVVGRDRPGEPPADWAVGLRGAYQRRNAAAALAALEALEGATGLLVPEAARRAGLAGATWPGRLEELPGGVLVDGAHNPQAARALAAELDVHLGRDKSGERRPIVAVLGLSQEKDVAGVVAPVAALAEDIVYTQAPSPRARPAADLAAAAPAPGRVVADYRAAVEEARTRVGQGGLVVVYGLLFLVGAVRAWLLGEPVDPVAAQDPPAGRANGRPETGNRRPAT